MLNGEQEFLSYLPCTVAENLCQAPGTGLYFYRLCGTSMYSKVLGLNPMDLKIYTLAKNPRL
jgi:hypothetical protein